MSPRPLIGITAAVEDARYGVWDRTTALVSMAYVDKVAGAGGRPVLIPPLSDAVAETLDALHGLLVSGGVDIEPAEYGAEPHPETRQTNPGRDRGEITLVRAADERDLPLLGICRGLEVLNVARGGDLDQHVPDTVGHGDHRGVPGEYARHEVSVVAGSRLAGMVGERLSVPSYHHQAPSRPGSGLVQVAKAADGTNEGMEDPSRGFCVGVLWHPEVDEDDSLFRGLVEAARSYRDGRS